LIIMLFNVKYDAYFNCLVVFLICKIVSKWNRRI
jgi:hypothetical protein